MDIVLSKTLYYIEHYVITNIPNDIVKYVGLSCSFHKDVDFHVDSFKFELTLEYVNFYSLLNFLFRKN